MATPPALPRRVRTRRIANFIAVGGDGTSYEIVNGLFPEADRRGSLQPLGFLPLGTGNSFLRDFTDRGVDGAMEALARAAHAAMRRAAHASQRGRDSLHQPAQRGFCRRRQCDSLAQLRGLGRTGIFPLDLSAAGAASDRRPFPLRVEGMAETDRRRCLFLPSTTAGSPAAP